MADAVDLREFQRRFLTLVTAPDDVAGALVVQEWEAETIAAGDARASAIERLDVYANMYFLRLRDALAEDFPVVLTMVGDDWDALAMDYLQACPPPPAIRNVGAAFAAWLRTRPGGERPWLADLAVLEWARADVFDRADEALLTLASLQALPPDGFVELPLRLVVAHEVVDVGSAVHTVWRQRSGAPEPGPHRLLVWRHGANVIHRAVDDDEGTALDVVRAGTTFGALCEDLARGRDDEDAARLASRLVRGWLDAGLLIAAP